MERRQAVAKNSHQLLGRGNIWAGLSLGMGGCRLCSLLHFIKINSLNLKVSKFSRNKSFIPRTWHRCECVLEYGCGVENDRDVFSHQHMVGWERLCLTEKCKNGDWVEVKRGSLQAKPRIFTK